MTDLFIVIVLILILAIAIAAISGSGTIESPERRVGRLGEQEATDIIRSVLREDDRLLTNVKISYDSRPAELDNVIINKYGVFIIEVKNYTGELSGNEDDYEWTKCHTTDAGNTYTKTVKNPIRQVKRQIYLLAKYLQYYSSTKVWIEGYSILLNGNSPVKSKYILSSAREIDRAVHHSEYNRLTPQEIDDISNLLS